MTTPKLSGTFGGTPTLDGRLGPGVFSGSATTLPAELDNGVVRLRFVAHALRGVTLDTITDLTDERATVDAAAQTFAWQNAVGSTGDGEHDGGLWRLVTQSQADAFTDVLPGAEVAVTATTDLEGRDALMFRWADVALPTSGTVTVTLLVALGDGDRAARWWVSVARAGEESDSIDYVECPRLAIHGPVATRSGGTHADSQVRARHLLPAFDRPDLNATNTPLSRWVDRELVTHHPSGDADTTTQPMQFEALAALDPQDTASEGRVLVLAAGDGRGAHKRFVRAGTHAGETFALRWAHRFYPPWAKHPAVDVDADASRYGNVFYPSYPVLTGCVHAPTAHWWHSAAALYRDLVATPSARVPKAFDGDRSDLARGTPWVGAIRQEPNMDGATVGALTLAWAEQHRDMTGADRIVAQVNPVRPSITRATPPLAYGAIRGCNYLPMATVSHCLHLSLVPLRGEFWADTTGGFFWAPIAQQEIDLLAGVGFNAVRFWGSFLGWYCDPVGYIASLKSYCQMLRAHGMRMSYIPFNVIPAGAAAAGLGAQDLISAGSYTAAGTKTVLWGLCDAWNTTASGSYPLPTDEVDLTHWPEPMTHLGWLSQGRFGEWTDTALQTAVGDYVRAVARFFAQDDDGAAVFLSYDVVNEANLQYAPGGTANAVLREYLLDFMAKVVQLLRQQHPAAACTVGWAETRTNLTTELARRGAVLDYVSMHSYNYTVSSPAAHEARWADIEATMADTKAEADALGVPWVLSECFVLPENDGEMARYLDPLTALGGGGFTWCYLRNNAYRAGPTLFDGIANCTTPAKLIRKNMFGNAWSDGWSDGWGGSALRFTVEYPTDDAAVRAWVLT